MNNNPSYPLDKYAKPLPERERFWVLVSRILYSAKSGTIAIYLGPTSQRDSSGTPVDCSQGTALHSGKDFAVSAGLNRVVSVLTSILTDGRRYLLPVFSLCICGREDWMFGLSSSRFVPEADAAIWHLLYYLIKLAPSKPVQRPVQSSTLNTSSLAGLVRTNVLYSPFAAL